MLFCATMRVIGIDEAGYGPLLGPLTVGAVSIDCAEGYDADLLWEAIGPEWGIADSKAVLSHRNMAAGEETTLSVLAAVGIEAATRRELLAQVLLPAPDLRMAGAAPAAAACLERSPRFFDEACAPDEQAIPRWGAAPSPERTADLRRRLASVGVRVAAARAIAVCPGRFNQAVGAGVSKLDVDWRLFAEMLRCDREELAPSGLAVCGKLGSRSRYGAQLMDLGLSSVITESRALSTYDVSDLGRVEFIRHAEAAHAPVAMASMIAKLVRELLLDQWHIMLAKRVEGLETCSGYRDVVTKRYVKDTAAARKKLGVPDRCFLRDK